MKKQNSYSLNIGLPTILLVFVIMCLLSFSILSFVSAKADLNLCTKAVDRQNKYYATCNEAEIYLKVLDEQLHTLYDNAQSLDVYQKETKDIPSSVSFSISDLQRLDITIDIYSDPIIVLQQSENLNSKNLQNQCFYQITSWKVTNKDDISYDDRLHVIP